MSNTSIGRGPASGGNENHDGDPSNTTLGETVKQERPAGSDVLEAAAPDLPSGVQGGPAKPGVAKETAAYPDAPNIAEGPWELDAARGQLPSP